MHDLLWLSRPLTPSGHFCQTLSPAFVFGQQRNESNTIGQDVSLESVIENKTLQESLKTFELKIVWHFHDYAMRKVL